LRVRVGAGRRPLALDDVVDFEHFGLARVEAEFCEDRHQASTERIELLFGVPDQTDVELVARAEADS
jgi:phage portal protein BeeE